jgi:CubicO group peptidase (beta-lactamase class C family)
MRLSPIPFLLLFLFATGGNAQQNPLPDLDGYIKSSMAEWQIPGLAIAVVKDDRVVFLHAYGVRQMGREARVDAQTIFPLGSLTKAFTALAVGVLVDEGKLAWDDRVTKYLPWLEFADPWVTRNVTVRDLLSHRVAGGWGGSSYPFLFLTGFGFRHDEALRRMRYLGGSGDGFRSRWEYDNANYWAAGALVAAVAGMPWQDFVRSRIFAPLGMASATTDSYALWDPKAMIPCSDCNLEGHTVSLEDARVPNISVPHRLGDDGVVTAPIYPFKHDPSGSIYANISDAAQWVRLQLGTGMFNGQQLLRPGTFAEMHTAQVSMPADAVLQSVGGNLRAYGFGWDVTNYRGKKMVMHGGGFAAYIGLLPEERLGVVVLGNLDTQLREALVLRVFDAYLGAPARDWSKELLDQARLARERGRAQGARAAAAQPPGDERPGPASTYAGVYTHPAFGDVSVEQVGEKLVLSFVGGQVGDLQGWGHDSFRVNWRSPDHYRTLVTFNLTGGAAESLTLQFPAATFRRRE